MPTTPRSFLCRIALRLRRIAEPFARSKESFHSFWRRTSAHRRFARVTGILLFGCMTVVIMGDNGCEGCEIVNPTGDPLPGFFQGFVEGLAGVHYHTNYRPHFTGSDGSQTGTASFLGNLTSITQPTSTYFAMLRMADCSLLLATGTSPLDGTFTLKTTANSNYEQTLHQLAGLKTTPGVFANGCKEGTTDLSARVAVNAGVTKSNIAVLATAESNGSSNAVFVLTADVNQSKVSFNAIPGTNAATALVTADLDGDGSGDLVAVNGYNATSSYVTVMLGNADGTFKTPVNYPTAGNYSVTATLDDIDGDGKLDIVSVSADQQISILTGKGDGTFNAAQSFAAPALPGSSLPAASTPITNIITADVNGDGKRDLICSNGLVLLGDGHGNFTAATSAAFPFIQSSTSAGPFIATGDLNNDGKQDLVLGNGSSISIYLGNGNGTFTPGTSYPSINNTGYVSVVDLDGDGNLDIYNGLAEGGIYSGDNSSFASAYILMGKGDGTFVGAPRLNSGTYNGTNLGDVNGDGFPDVITNGIINAQTASFSVQLGNGHGFTTASTITPPASFTLSVNGTMETITNANKTAATTYAVADINGDGKADLVFVDSGLTVNGSGSDAYPVYFVALSNGDGTFQAPVPHAFPQLAPASGFDVSLAVSNLQIADFNHDGKADLIVSYDETAGGLGTVPYNRGFAVVTGNGDGTFSTTPILTSTYSSATAPNTALLPQVVSTADLNGDGRPDLIGINPTFSIGTGAVTQLLTYVGNGDGTFKAPSTFAIAANVYGTPVLADFNKDGKLDLAFLAETSASQAELAIANGNGDGTFATATILNLAGGDSIRSASLAAADFDADGNIDLALLDSNDYSGIFYGKGDGTFTSVPLTGSVVPKGLINIAANNNGSAIAIDLNKDGKPDILASSTALLNIYGSAPNVLTATTTAVTASASSIVVGGSITFTATVSPASGTTTPTGIITFTDGTTTLGTAPLASGVATYTTSVLAVGSHTITAAYAGAAGAFSGSTSNSLPISITTASANFSISLSPTSSTVVHGSTATTTLTIASVGGFSAATSLTCTGAPANSICSISPTSVTPGTSPATATVTLQTSVTTASLAKSLQSFSLAALPLGFIAALALFGLPRKRRWPMPLLAFTIISCLLATTGCGGKGNSTNKTSTATAAPGTYTLTITGTSSAISNSTPWTVIIQ
ncbi:MAG: FG-GAP-like repeat-containing protein [Edaphobacter sp.]